MSINLQRFFKRFILIVLPFILGLTATAQTIKGTVNDARNHETLIGATVHIEKEGTKLNTGVRLDGTYLFKNVPPGVYKLQASYVGYQTSKEYTVELKGAGDVVTLNIDMVDNAKELTEVSVNSHASKATDVSARATEKNANNTINAVSAQAIAISPDVLVSNVLSRVPGISIDRSNTGDAQHVIIRGMDKQYNTTLVNGIKIPSPDNKNRYVPLDIFPAGLVDRIEVSKTLTPDMEGDASGGVVNLVMKSAPDGLKVEGELGTGYSQLFFDRSFKSFNGSTVNSKSPGEIHPGQPAQISEFPYQNLLTKSKNAPPNANASLTIGDRFLNNKLGVLFSGSYQNLYQGDNSFVVLQENTVGPSNNINTPNQETAFQSSYNRQYSSQLSRLGTVASLDYRFDANNVIKLFGTYVQLDEYRVRDTHESTYGGYSYQGYRGTFSVDDRTQTRTDLQNILNLTLSGKHNIFKGFSVDWTGAASKASNKLPDIAEFDTNYGTQPTSTTNQPTGNPNEPYTSVASSIQNSPVMVGKESRDWQHNTDKDLSGYVNLHYNTNIFNRPTEFSAGGMYRHKTRDNYSNAYSLPYTYINGTNNAELYTSIPDATFSFGNVSGSADGTYESDPGVYTFTENVSGVYGMVKYYATDKLDVIFGLRSENTSQNYYSSLPATFPGKTGSISYIDYLPSVNIKYALTDDQALRASYFKSILRPAFADLIPFPDVTPDDPYAHLGNPYLQHTVVDNFDLRYEFFPGVFDEFMVGGFYKHLTNPIETVLLPASEGSTLFLEPVNPSRAAHNYGAEIVAKKFFGDFGGAINYTYTQSQITTAKSINVNGEVTTREQTRPLQGQAAHVGNLSFLYRNQKQGIDAQLSLSYTGERIQAVSNYYGLDTWERPSTYLDFSAQKKVGKHFIIYVKANNLLNTPYELILKQNNQYNHTGILKYEHQESANYTTVQYDQYYSRYNLGVKYSF